MPTATRDTILQVASRLFAKQGYTATSVRQIAQQSRIGKATIYHHFPDKQAIVIALLKRNTNKMREMLSTVEGETEPRARIRLAVEASLNFLNESSDILQVVRREIPGGRAEIQTGLASFFRTYGKLLAEALQQGKKQGLFRAIDPDAGARVLMTMIQGTYAMTYIVGERFQPTAKTVAALLDVFFHGVERK